MRKSLPFMILLCFVTNLHTQSPKEIQNAVSSSKKIQITNKYLPDEILGSKLKITEIYSDIQGTPYIENFSGIKNNIPLGKFFDAEMNPIGVAFTLYNAYTDEMEVSAIEDSESFYRLKKESNSLYIKLQKKLYRAYVSDYQMNYFVILSETDKEKCTLLKKEKIIYVKGSGQNVSLVKNESSSFRRIKDSYYLKLNNIVRKMPYKKKIFFSFFKEKSALVATYAKQKKLKLSSEEDLLAIINYYNTLK